MTVVFGGDANGASINKGVKRNFQRDFNWTSIAGIDGDGGGDSKLGKPKEMEHR